MMKVLLEAAGGKAPPRTCSSELFNMTGRDAQKGTDTSFTQIFWTVDVDMKACCEGECAAMTFSAPLYQKTSFETNKVGRMDREDTWHVEMHTKHGLASKPDDRIKIPSITGWEWDYTKDFTSLADFHANSAEQCASVDFRYWDEKSGFADKSATHKISNDADTHICLSLHKLKLCPDQARPALGGEVHARFQGKLKAANTTFASSTVKVMDLPFYECSKEQELACCSGGAWASALGVVALLAAVLG